MSAGGGEAPGPPGPADPASGGHDAAGTTSRRGLLAGLAMGVPVMAYGARGAFVDASDTHPAEVARWFVGLALLNDLVVVPFLLVGAWALRRATPAWAWPALRAGLIVAGTLALVGWPFVRGYGEDPTNPSRLPATTAPAWPRRSASSPWRPPPPSSPGRWPAAARVRDAGVRRRSARTSWRRGCARRRPRRRRRARRRGR